VAWPPWRKDKNQIKRCHGEVLTKVIVSTIQNICIWVSLYILYYKLFSVILNSRKSNINPRSHLLTILDDTTHYTILEYISLSAKVSFTLKGFYIPKRDPDKDRTD
jgi:hypothetical protein